MALWLRVSSVCQNYWSIVLCVKLLTPTWHLLLHAHSKVEHSSVVLLKLAFSCCLNLPWPLFLLLPSPLLSEWRRYCDAQRHAVCVFTTLVITAKVMRCIQCSLFSFSLHCLNAGSCLHVYNTVSMLLLTSVTSAEWRWLPAVHCVSKKVHPYYFHDNNVKRKPI